MKGRTIFFAVVILATASAAVCQSNFYPADKKGVPDLYIVVLNQNVARRPTDTVSALPRVPEVAADLGQIYGGQVERVWEHVLQGFTIRLSESRARSLAEDTRVASVSQSIYLPDPGLSAPVDDCYEYPAGHDGYDVNTRRLPVFSPQSLSCSNPDPQSGTSCVDNWGLDRIDQTSVTRNGVYSFNNQGFGVPVYVLDTGVLDTHNEFSDRRRLASRVTGGVNATVPANDPERFNTTDCYGHGTHVAAILGGRTYGVAKDVLIHPVRISPCDPEDFELDFLIDGLEWIAANHDPDVEGTAVVNWSGGNDYNLVHNPSHPYVDLQQAVRNLAADNTLLLVESAGNQSDETHYHDACDYSFGDESDFTGSEAEAVARIFVVGGSDESDERWTRREGDPGYPVYCGTDCGSNVGRCLDIFAPAAHVVSASYKDGAGYCRLSGTSMAAPHVSGVAALYLQRHRETNADDVKEEIMDDGLTGALQTDSNDPNYIGDDSPDLLVQSDVPVGTCGVDLTLTTAENTQLAFYASDLVGNGCDNGDTAQANLDPEYGSLHIAGVSGDVLYHYDPAKNFTGSDTFTYTIKDAQDSPVASGLVTVTVTP
jgi:subtilisin family serine protease